jgi:hypothetical protein
VSIDEDTLRETKSFLIGGITELQKQSGKLPDVRKAEEMIDPVLRKVDEDSEAERHKPQPKPTEREFREGEWYGEEGHSPQIGVAGKSRIAGAAPGEKLKVSSRVLGQYDISGKHAVPLNGAPDGKRQMDARETVVRDLVRELYTLPEWKKRFREITYSNMSPVEREKAYRKILADAVRLFGAPKPTAIREKKIIVSK